ncbi:Asp-tRNA(Asn)/Glu-tRNA(Gln) amidotransferase GatCAB subunit B, partial [Planctomycetota bacterium]
SGITHHRGWNDARNETVFQREKEEAHDYRYFPEPDLVPVELDDVWLGNIKSDICELPMAMKKRFMRDYDLNNYDAGVLTADRATAEFFDGAVKAGGSAKRVANLVTQFGLKNAHERNCRMDELGATMEQVAQLAQLTEEGAVSASAAFTIFEKMLNDKSDPKTIAEKHSLIQQSDAGALEAIVDEVIAANPQAVEEVKSGGKKTKKARGFLMGQIMQKTKGQANPKIAGELLDKKL